MATREMQEDVTARFATLDSGSRKKLLHWRDLVFEVAAADTRIGPLTETLKWQQPSYLAETTKSGGTLRLWINNTGRPTLFVTCSSNIAEQVKEHYIDDLDFEGARAIMPRPDTDDAVVRHVIAQVLTYKLK